MRFIHDSNLGFPSGQNQWPKFFSAGQCDIFGTNNIQLINQTLENDLDIFAYIPVACAYNERKISEIQGLVSATTGKSGALTTSSVLIVKRDTQLRKLTDLRGKIYGRINQYCTSSYFAPAIHLHENGFKFNEFFEKIIEVAVRPGNWQNQIDEVIRGTIDATMVDENTWLACPKNAEQTEVIGRLDGLPCPIVVSKSIVNTEFFDLFKTKLLTSPRDNAAMFSGFAPYPEDDIKIFFKRISNAFDES
jgi:ABC-type phosphate/phosphonate transport system substrate-binding protein